MKHKVLAILLCLAIVLSMTLPGTLAVSMDEDESQSLLTTEKCTCGTEDGTHAEDCPLYEKPSADDQEEPAENGEDPSEDDSQAPADDQTQQPPEDETGGDDTQKDDTQDDQNPTQDPDEEEEPTEEMIEGELPADLEPHIPATGVKFFDNAAPLMQMDVPMTLDLYGRAKEVDSGVVLNKSAKANKDGTYTITLDAYATGTSSTITNDIPADIVLVLDVSNSMRNALGENQYVKVYGNTTKQNQDGTGKNTHTSYIDKTGATVNANTTYQTLNAYHVEGHDASKYQSNMQTYYIDVNGDGTYKKVFYYHGPDGTPPDKNQSGWYTWDSSGVRGPYIPKTSANDTAQNHYQFAILDSSVSRLAVLKEAVNGFVDSVYESSPNSTIAMVSYASSATTESGFLGSTGKDSLKATVNGLEMDIKNGTRTDLAMNQANSLLATLTNDGTQRNRVVVVFTDGKPEWYQYDSIGEPVKDSSGNQVNVQFDQYANAAIDASNASINSYGATVYTIGVVKDASGSLESFVPNDTTNINTFLHLVSSNYPDAQSMTNSGERNRELKDGESYYLTTSTRDGLNDIFQQISEEVGGATNTTLGTETVIKDIIAPSFTVPANTSDIKIYTADCTGAGLTFGTRTEVTSGITTTIKGDTLDVKGFDFSANWCGDHSGTYSGKKLIIEFTVKPKDGFLGGNDVPTNGEKSGMYSDGKCIGGFEVPAVNVPIKNVTVKAEDKNVYLLADLTDAEIKSGFTAKCGDVTLNLNAENYGLEAWQTEYVNITVTCKDDKGNDVTNLNDLEGSKSYTAIVTITPKTPEPTSTVGTKAETKSGNAKGWIYVFTPVLTFKDSQVWYGDTAPTDYTANKDGEVVWECGNKKSTDTDITMTGDEPTLDLTYTPESSKIVDGKIATKDDIAVNVAVEIEGTDVTENTDIKHTKCDDSESEPTNGKFWLHVNTCQLTITKTGGADDESYVFDVYKDGTKYTEVTICGNDSETIYELPVGTYIIQENTGWSWRYNADNGSPVALSAEKTSGSITCTNTSNTNQWLNGFSTIVTNIYDATKSN